MIFLFYISGIVAVLSTLCVILSYHPMYALLYLIISFLSTSCVLFSLGALFAGVIEVIVYAGAIMVLFVFIVMLLNTENVTTNYKQKCDFIDLRSCCGVILSSSILCIIIFYMIAETKDYFIYISILAVDVHRIGYKLFGFYMLIVEAASFLLLAALVSVLHISHKEYRRVLK